MVITPQTNIRLLKVPFEMDNKNQLTFADATAQYNYFDSLTGTLEYENCTYQRKDGYMAINEDADTLQSYNYCMYQNEQYGNKWFYAFITNITYEGNEVSYVYIKTDVWQTWQFDITWKNSFVEREHVNDDTLGLHTIPENLETGEYIINSVVDLYSSTGSDNVCIMCSDLPDEIKSNTSFKFGVYGGILSGCYMVIPNSATVELSTTNFCRAMDELAKADAIIGIFVIPNDLLPTITYTTFDIDVGGGHYISTSVGILPTSTSATTLNTSTSFTTPSTIDGYTPVNNKVKCYPYSYFYVTNNVGSDIEFHYEDFVSNSASFKTVGIITPNCSIRCVPLNYKKLADSSSMNSYNYGIAVGKYPICSWRSDLFVNWLKENSYNLGLSIGGGVMATTMGLVTGNVTSTLAGAGAIATAVGQIYQHRLTPDQANGNTNTNDVTYSVDKIKATAYKMTIRSEYAKVIDNFFSMYGYKVNMLKTPNITGRTNWNYVKTIGCNIIGDIPQKDLQELKSLFDNGITLWHNASKFLDYSQTNSIIS